jgi:hypothetical protein
LIGTLTSISIGNLESAMKQRLMDGFRFRDKPSPELIDHYEWSAGIHGEKEIKFELATARCTATTLYKASYAIQAPQARRSAAFGRGSQIHAPAGR